MKRIFIGIVGVASLLTTSALAADLAPRMYTKAPAPVVAIYDWTGFYIGGNIGYSWGRSSTTEALGDALTPLDVRVRGAMQRILARKSWTEIQRKWLKRIEEQLLREVVVDRASIDEEPFRADGGFQRLNKIFGGQLDAVLGDINEELWKKAA